MTLAHDAQTRFPATNGTTGVNSGDVTTGDRTFTHTPVGTPKGVVLVLLNQTVTTSVVTGVLYGGVAMTLVESHVDATEVGRIEVYVLASVDVPTGPQTVTLQGCTASNKWCTVSTVTAATSQTREHISSGADTTTTANPSVSLSTSAPTISYGGIHTGAAAPATAVGAGCTLQHSNDYGALSANTLRRTSEDAAGTIVLSATLASDDWCSAGVALEEFEPATAKTLSDSGAGGDVVQVAAAVPLADAGSGADTLLVDKGLNPKTLSDSGSGSDALVVAVAVPLADAGSGSDALPQVIERPLSSADATTGTTTATTLAVSPTGQQVGDWLYAVLSSSGGTQAHAAPDGTWIQAGSTGFYGSNVALSGWMKKVTATGETYTFTIGPSTRRGTLTVRAFTGVDPNATSPLEGTPTADGGAGRTSVTCPSQAVGAMGDLLLLASVHTVPAGTTATMDNPAGFAETSDLCSANATLTNCSSSLNTRPVGPGDTGTQAITSSDLTAGAWGGLAVLFSPTPVAGPTQVTLSDSGSGADQLTVAVDVPLADAGSGSDALTVDQGTTPKTLSDSGSGTDSLAVAAQVPFTDAGAGSDAIRPAVALTVTDAGSGADALATAATVPLADAGSGADQIRPAVGLTLTDSGAGTDQLAPTVGVSLPDAGSGSDQLTLAVGATLTDSGTGQDNLTVPESGSIAKTLSDAGSGSDSLTVSAAVLLADAGTAAETLTVNRPLTLSDAGSASDTLAVAASVPLPDAGAGADTLRTAVALTLPDSGAGADTLTVPESGQAITKTLVDSGSGADTLAVAVQLPLTDSGSAADQLAVAAGLSLAEQGSGTDSIAGIGIGLADSGSATDSLAVQSTVPLTDTGSGADRLAVAAALPLADAGSGADSLFIDQAKFLTLSDSGSAQDSLSVAAVKFLTDAGTGSDRVTVAAAVPLTDQAIGVDTLALAVVLLLADNGRGVDRLITRIFASPVHPTPTPRVGSGGRLGTLRRGGAAVGTIRKGGGP